MTHFNNHQLQEIRLLLQQNRKVEAVKYVKDHSNLGLKESKDFVDQFENQAQFFYSEYAHQNTDDLNTSQTIQHHEILSLIQQGRKIEAIKLVMDQSHLGLKDAKDFVEELAENPDSNILDFESDQDFYQRSHPQYKSIQTNYSTGEIFILYQDGRKERIDEHHSDWDDIMDQFGGGASYDSATDYLTAMQTRTQKTTTDATLHAHTRPSASTSPLVGIEDQSKKKRSPLFIIVIVIIIAFILYLLSTR